MDISIIIACRNGEATLGETLDSLLVQSCEQPWEIVLADNGSTDGSRALFERVAAAHPEVSMRVLDASERPGKAFALNKAIAESPSRFFLFCDADDLVAPGWLAAMARALETEPFVAARMDTATLNPDWARIGRGRLQATECSRIDYEPFCKFAGGATLGFHREVFDALGGFDTGFAHMEDVDFCIRAAQAGYDLLLVPDAVYIYRFRQTPGSIRRQIRNYERYRALLRKRYARNTFFLAPGPWLPVLSDLGFALLWRAAHVPPLLKSSPRSEVWFNRTLGKTTGIILGSLAHRVPPPRRAPREERVVTPRELSA